MEPETTTVRTKSSPIVKGNLTVVRNFLGIPYASLKHYKRNAQNNGRDVWIVSFGTLNVAMDGIDRSCFGSSSFHDISRENF